MSLIELMVSVSLAGLASLALAVYMQQVARSDILLQTRAYRDELASMLGRYAGNPKVVAWSWNRTGNQQFSWCLQANAGGTPDCMPIGNTWRPFVLYDPTGDFSDAGDPLSGVTDQGARYYTMRGKPCDTAIAGATEAIDRRCPIAVSTAFRALCPASAPGMCDQAELIEIRYEIKYLVSGAAGADTERLRDSRGYSLLKTSEVWEGVEKAYQKFTGGLPPSLAPGSAPFPNLGALPY